MQGGHVDDQCGVEQSEEPKQELSGGVWRIQRKQMCTLVSNINVVGDNIVDMEATRMSHLIETFMKYKIYMSIIP
jgi:hypothetical protein